MRGRSFGPIGGLLVGCGLILAVCTTRADDALPVERRVAVVCPAEWRGELADWVKHRAAQGWSAVWIDPSPTAAELRAALAAEQRRAPYAAVLLVGDEAGQGSDKPSIKYTIPTFYVAARVIDRWNGGKVIASDLPYVDFDNDEIPNAAIGRWPVKNIAELRVIRDKTLAFEAPRIVGPSRLRLNLVAGVGGFGPLTDAAIEQGARTIVTSGLSPAYEASLTFGSWTSPHCPDPRRFCEMTAARMTEDALLSVYIGHGQVRELDRVIMPDNRRYLILNNSECRALPKQAHPAPPALLLACLTGAFDQPDDSLAESLVLAEHGPVAVIAGSRVCMPFGLSLFASEALHTTMVERTTELGEIVRRAKVAAAAEFPVGEQRPVRKLLESTAGLLTPGGHDARVEIREHAHLLHCFGDPCLRLRLPSESRLQLPAQIAPDTDFVARWQLPKEIADGATIHWELRLPLGVVDTAAENRDRYRADERQWAEFQQTYEATLPRALHSQTATARDGESRATFRLPAGKRGRYVVRAWFSTPERDYTAAGEVTVE